MHIYIYICNHENNVPSGYHHNGFAATHAFGHMMYMDHLWPLILCSLLCLFSTLWFIGTSNV